MTTWESVSRGHIFEILKDYEYTNKWLDIGSGKGNQTYSTLDKNKGVQATYTGDIRTLFAPVYNKKVPHSLKQLRHTRFPFVKMQHIVEHIEWIYQEFMMRWVYSILTGDGVLFIETPNLEYILKQYTPFTSSLAKQHPDIKEDDPDANVKWLNFKLYSGCSTNEVKNNCIDGDFHLCMYNKDWLISILLNVGFKYIKINDGDTLSCLAYKRWE